MSRVRRIPQVSTAVWIAPADEPSPLRPRRLTRTGTDASTSLPPTRVQQPHWRWWRRYEPRHDVRRPQPGSESQRVRDNASVRRRQGPGAWALCYPASGWRQPKPHLSPRFMRRTAGPTAGPRQFSLDGRGAGRDNGPVISVAACTPHAGNCLNRHTDDALRLPGLVQLEIPAALAAVAAFASTNLGRHPWCAG